jgi:hypothetical protein
MKQLFTIIVLVVSSTQVYSQQNKNKKRDINMQKIRNSLQILKNKKSDQSMTHPLLRKECNIFRGNKNTYII